MENVRSNVDSFSNVNTPNSPIVPGKYVVVHSHSDSVSFKTVADSSSLINKTRLEYIFTIIGGCLMSLNAGYINACCFSGFAGEYSRNVNVAGYTGSTTKTAIAAIDANFGEFGFVFLSIGFFAMGALLSGLLNPEPI